LLRPRDERPRDNDPRKKFDKFPPPHGFARAKGLDRVSLGYHILDREIVPLVTHQAGLWHLRFGSKADKRNIAPMSALPPIADIGP
jgi:hypothetical protein